MPLTLELLARLLPKLLAGFTQRLEVAETSRMQQEAGCALAAFQTIAIEAKRERMINLVAEPDPAPLARTLLRLRHDVVIHRAGRRCAAAREIRQAPRPEARARGRIHEQIFALKRRRACLPPCPATAQAFGRRARGLQLRDRGAPQRGSDAHALDRRSRAALYARRRV
jgi:hypothetical protein